MASSWKPSTLLVITAFGVSIVLLFAKSELMLQRLNQRNQSLAHHAYSPAAADPNLRNQEKASRLTDRPAKAKTVAQTATTPKPREEKQAPSSDGDNPAKRSTPASESNLDNPAASPASAKTTVSTEAPGIHPRFKATPAPKGHEYFVIVASFQTFENAEKGLAEFHKSGFPKAYVGVFNEGRYYSIIGQTFASESEARALVVSLEKDRNIKALIYRQTEQ